MSNGKGNGAVRLVGNLIWFVLAGLWLAIGYLVAAALMAITIIGLPFAFQAVELALYALWPFGRTLIKAPTRRKGLSVVGNRCGSCSVGGGSSSPTSSPACFCV